MTIDARPWLHDDRSDPAVEYRAPRFLVVLHRPGVGTRTATIAADASDDLWAEAARAFPGWEIQRARPLGRRDRVGWTER